jgi:hypothetical protein
MNSVPRIMTMNRVPDFEPSTHGFHFANNFPRGPVLTIWIPGLGSIGIGNAAGGLCGGMVFTVRDFFEARQSPPQTTQVPDPGTRLFRFLARRLLDSFNLPGGVLKYYRWMTCPDGNHKSVQGLAWRTIHQEWPLIRAMIDRGHPCPLGLVTVQSLAPHRLGENHQVLAYGYDLDEEKQHLSIQVYDPNHPHQDDLTLSLAIDQPTQATPITFSTGMPVRGFFRTRYAPAEVSSMLARS